MELAKAAAVIAVIMTAGSANVYAQQDTDWQGGYAGITAGLDRTNTQLNLDALSVDDSGSGPNLGLIAGFNVTPNDRFLFGLEGHLDYSTAKNDIVDDPSDPNSSVTTVRRRLAASINARAGLTFGARNQVLVYAAAGYGFSNWNFESDGAPISDSLPGAKNSHSINGIRYGGGLEVAFNERFRGRLSVMRNAGKSSPISDLNLTPADFGGTTFTIDHGSTEFRLAAIFAF